MEHLTITKSQGRDAAGKESNNFTNNISEFFISTSSVFGMGIFKDPRFIYKKKKKTGGQYAHQYQSFRQLPHTTWYSERLYPTHQNFLHLSESFSLGAMEHDPKLSVNVFSLLIIPLWNVHSDIQGSVTFSPLSNLRNPIWPSALRRFVKAW